MFRHILVPLDGSQQAERILPFAQALAAAPDTDLVLLRVIPPDDKPSDRDTSAGHPTLRSEAMAYLTDVSERLLPASTDRMVVEGESAHAILGAIAARGIDLIAMSTHGRSGIGRWIYGSVADAVLRHAAVPVLLASSTMQLTRWRTDRPLRLMVSLDYSAVSEAVLEPACVLAATLKAELILLSVAPLLVTPEPYSGLYLAYDPEQDRSERRAYLEGVAAKLRAQGLTVTVRDAFGLVDTEILGVAREEGADLIALATHGNGGVTRLVMGSTATSIVQRAAVPVLIVRPTDAGDEPGVTK